jgi:hypothetical protein
MKESAKLLQVALTELKTLDNALKGDDLAAIEAARTTVKEAVDKTNEQIRSEYYANFLETDNPFLEAIKVEFLDVYRLVEKLKDDVASAEILPRKELIDLEAFEKSVTNRQLAVNGQWIFWVEKFAYVVGARATKDIGGNMDKFANAFKISATAKECDIGATPTSNRQMTKQLQTIIDGIVFVDNGDGLNELKAETRDVARIITVACRDAKDSNNVVMPRAKTVRNLIVKAMNRIALNGTYEAE